MPPSTHPARKALVPATHPRVALLACALLIAATAPARAAHPLVTEDAGTQGCGVVEVETGLSWTHASGGRAFAVQPQLTLGATETLDLIVQPSWLSVRAADGDRAQGWGDTNLDLKWRFLDAAPWSLAVRAGFLLPTSQSGLGLPHGEAASHATLVASAEAGSWTLLGNLGYARFPS